MKIPAAPRAVLAVERGTAQSAQGVSFSQAIRSKRYWSLTVALCLIVAAVVSMVGTTVPLLRDKGLSAADASRIFGSFGVTLLGGRMVVGYLFDRFWAPGVAALTLLMPALGCLLLFLVGAQHVDLLVLATMLLGIGTGAEFDIATFLVVRYFGIRDYGRLFSLQFSLTTLSAAIAPWLFGLLYSATGGYSAMLLICSSAFVAGALLLLPLGRYPRFDALRLA
jgi:cyanate permease